MYVCRAKHRTHSMPMKKYFFILPILFFLATTKIFSQTVYCNDAGPKYHTKACKYYSPNFEAVQLWKVRDIYHKTPCNLCHPPTKEVKGGGKKKAPAKKPAPAKKK